MRRCSSGVRHSEGLRNEGRADISIPLADARLQIESLKWVSRNKEMDRVGHRQQQPAFGSDTGRAAAVV
jgi:hypothetical protein